MVWAFVGIVIDVRNEDNPPSCLVRDERTGRDAWYRVAAQIVPPLRVGEWVTVGGSNPDDPRAGYDDGQVIDRVAPPAPPDASADTAREAAAAFRSERLLHIPKTLGPPPGEPAVWDRAGAIQMQRVEEGVRVSLVDRSGKSWAVVRRDAGGWTAGDGDAPRTLTAEAYAILDALVAVYRVATMHL